METRSIEFPENVDQTLEMLKGDGLLLTSVSTDGKPNVMTIGWGNPGVIWSRPIFVVLVRPSRFTFQNIEATGEFVVSVPTDGMGDVCMYCGTESGRDTNKFAGGDLTIVEAEAVRAPLIGECVRHYECKVVHYNDVADAALSPEIRAQAYAKGDLHRLYYGQILRVTERA